MAKVMDYKIFRNHTPELLENMIKDFLAEQNGLGEWEPYGGVSTHGSGDRIHCFCQVMVRKRYSFWEKLFLLT